MRKVRIDLTVDGFIYEQFQKKHGKGNVSKAVEDFMMKDIAS